MNLIINSEKCIGCGLCAQTCPSAKMLMQQDKPVWQGSCMMCGQCYSVCPQGAIEYGKPGKSDDFFKPSVTDEILAPAMMLQPQSLAKGVTPEQLRSALWTRRSVRRFTNEPVSETDLAYLLDAGHSAPTASNARDVRYIILKDRLEEIKTLAFEVLADTGRRMLDNEDELNSLKKYYAEKWIAMQDVYAKTGRDMLFFNAPLVILFVAKNPVNAPLAASHVNLMAEALGLGACYVGFAAIAASDPRFADAIGLSAREQLVCSLALGHPATTYHRIPARPIQNITFL